MGCNTRTVFAVQSPVPRSARNEVSRRCSSGGSCVVKCSASQKALATAPPSPWVDNMSGLPRASIRRDTPLYRPRRSPLPLHLRFSIRLCREVHVCLIENLTLSSQKKSCAFFPRGSPNIKLLVAHPSSKAVYYHHTLFTSTIVEGRPLYRRPYNTLH